MFKNIGSKIQGLAVLETGLGIMASILIGGIIMSQDESTIFLGFVIIILGSILSWISSFLLYGFGKLIENSDYLVQNTDIMVKDLKVNSKVNINDGTPADSNVTSQFETLNKWLAEGVINQEEYIHMVKNIK